MKTPHVAKVALITARSLIVFFAFGLSLFALDVFQPGKALVPMTVELVIHLSPSLLLLFLLAVTWKHPMKAAMIFFAIAGLFTVYFHTYRSLAQFGLLTVPILLPAALFYLSAAHGHKAASSEER